MQFSSFMQAVPTWLQLLLAVAITVGVTLASIKLLYPRILELSGEHPDHDSDGGSGHKDARAGEVTGEGPTPIGDPEAGETAEDVEQERREGSKPTAPEPAHLAGRVLGLVATAFVFLLAFTLGNLWSNAQDARSATQDEGAAWQRAVAIVEQLPAGQQAQLRPALDAYSESVRQVEWPYLEQANHLNAIRAHSKATSDVGKAMLAAAKSGAGAAPEWSLLTNSIDTMTSKGTERIEQLPQNSTPGLILLIGFLGVALLGLTAAFQPAPFGSNMFLMGTMAAIVALMLFVLVQAANPFIGGSGITPDVFG